MEAVPNLHAAVVDYAYSNVATAVLYEHRSTNSASDTDPSYPSSASATATAATTTTTTTSIRISPGQPVGRVQDAVDSRPRRRSSKRSSASAHATSQEQLELGQRVPEKLLMSAMSKSGVSEVASNLCVSCVCVLVCCVMLCVACVQLERMHTDRETDRDRESANAHCRLVAFFRPVAVERGPHRPIPVPACNGRLSASGCRHREE